jgi:hypothetical protein
LKLGVSVEKQWVSGCVVKRETAAFADIEGVGERTSGKAETLSS